MLSKTCPYGCGSGAPMSVTASGHSSILLCKTCKLLIKKCQNLLSYKTASPFVCDSPNRFSSVFCRTCSRELKQTSQARSPGRFTPIGEGPAPVSNPHTPLASTFIESFLLIANHEESELICLNPAKNCERVNFPSFQFKLKHFYVSNGFIFLRDHRGNYHYTFINDYSENGIPVWENINEFPQKTGRIVAGPKIVKSQGKCKAFALMKVNKTEELRLYCYPWKNNNFHQAGFSILNGLNTGNYDFALSNDTSVTTAIVLGENLFWCPNIGNLEKVEEEENPLQIQGQSYAFNQNDTQEIKVEIPEFGFPSRVLSITSSNSPELDLLGLYVGVKRSPKKDPEKPRTQTDTSHDVFYVRFWRKAINKQVEFTPSKLLFEKPGTNARLIDQYGKACLAKVNNDIIYFQNPSEKGQNPSAIFCPRWEGWKNIMENCYFADESNIIVQFSELSNNSSLPYCASVPEGDYICNLKGPTKSIPISETKVQSIAADISSTLEGIAPPLSGAHYQGKFIFLQNIGYKPITLICQIAKQNSKNLTGNEFIFEKSQLILKPNDLVKCNYDEKYPGWLVAPSNENESEIISPSEVDSHVQWIPQPENIGFSLSPPFHFKNTFFLVQYQLESKNAEAVIKINCFNNSRLSTDQTTTENAI